MYDIIEILHGLAVVGLMVTLPPLIALAVYYAVVDIDLHDSIRRLPTTLLYLAADIARRPALAHLPVNSEPRTLSDAARDAQAREWFTTAEQRAVRRLPTAARTAPVPAHPHPN